MTNRLIKIVAVKMFILCLTGCETTVEEKFAAAQKRLMPAADDLTRAEPMGEVAGDPYIKGKIAVFNRAEIATKQSGADGKAFFMTPLYFRELEEIYAAEPNEVGTVAIVDCEKIEKGVYRSDDGREMPAEVEDCVLRLIDRTENVTIFERKFEKDPSDERYAYGNSIVRQSSEEDIVQYLKGLPRK